MFSLKWEANDDICPVRDELLGELCRANDLFIPGFVYSLAPDIRASLALFCYRRGHLRSMGLAIAASCSEADLMRQGGNVGAFLYAYSQEVSPQEKSSRVIRRKITLSAGALRVFATDDEPAMEPAQSLRPVPVPV
jgi:hypothetical protein